MDDFYDTVVDFFHAAKVAHILGLVLESESLALTL